MKTTGIIRRIDDLGRVTIPKQIRHDLGIAEGEPMELFVDGEKVSFIKYHPCCDCCGEELTPSDKYPSAYSAEVEVNGATHVLCQKCMHVIQWANNLKAPTP